MTPLSVALLLIAMTLYFWVYLRFGRQHREPAKPLPPKEPQPICGCGHHYSVHDDANVCHSISNQLVSREPKVMKVGYEGEDHEVHYVEKYAQVPCSCQRYTGPEPLPTYIP